jgi:hypothetical protein
MTPLYLVRQAYLTLAYLLFLNIVFLLLFPVQFSITHKYHIVKYSRAMPIFVSSDNVIADHRYSGIIDNGVHGTAVSITLLS